MSDDDSDFSSDEEEVLADGSESKAAAGAAGAGAGAAAAAAPAKESRGMRAKKFLASKSMGTRAGRNLVLKLLGNEGAEILDALKSSAVTHTGSKKKGKELKKDVLRVAMKAKFALDAGKLSKDEMQKLQEPINELCLMMLDFLNKTGDVSMNGLVDKYGAVRDSVVKLMEPHMRDKNIKKLKGLFEFYSDRGFLEAVRDDEKMKKERDLMEENLAVLLRPLIHEHDIKKRRPTIMVCQQANCMHPRALMHGDFMGSRYCPKHHLFFHSQFLLEKPTSKQVLDPQEECSKFLVQYIVRINKEKGGDAAGAASRGGGAGEEKSGGGAGGGRRKGGVSDLAVYHFYDAASKFRTLSRHLRKGRAELIVNRYLLHDSLKAIVDPKSVEAIQSDLLMADARNPPKGTLFDPASNAALKRLEEIIAGFLESPEYKGYVVSITMPEKMMAMAKAGNVAGDEGKDD